LSAARPCGHWRRGRSRPVIGYLSARAPGNSADIIAAFRQGLKEVGFIEGENVTIESRFAEGNFDRLPALAADLVARKVNVVVATGGTVSVVKAKPVVPTTVPIVFAMGGDPVKLGVVASLNRPSENATGVAFLVNGLASKQMELLHTLVPTTDVIGFLVNPKDPNAETDSKDAQAAAALLGSKVVVGTASIESEIEATLASFAQQHVGALFVDAEPFLLDNRNRILKLAAEAAVPVVSQFRLFAQDGGLASYGTSLTDANRLLGVYTGRILKGEKPSDLPVVQSTKFDLVINLTTAKTLGIVVPSTLIAIADEVIE
jgi:putative ABC transport system substrate-binding protein